MQSNSSNAVEPQILQFHSDPIIPSVFIELVNAGTLNHQLQPGHVSVATSFKALSLKLGCTQVITCIADKSPMIIQPFLLY